MRLRLMNFRSCSSPHTAPANGRKNSFPAFTGEMLVAKKPHKMQITMPACFKQPNTRQPVRRTSFPNWAPTSERFGATGSRPGHVRQGDAFWGTSPHQVEAQSVADNEPKSRSRARSWMDSPLAPPWGDRARWDSPSRPVSACSLGTGGCHRSMAERGNTMQDRMGDRGRPGRPNGT